MDIYVELYRYLYPHRFLFLRGHHLSVMSSITVNINFCMFWFDIIFWRRHLERCQASVLISLKELICISFVASHFEIIVSNVRSPLVSIKYKR